MYRLNFNQLKACLLRNNKISAKYFCLGTMTSYRHFSHSALQYQFYGNKFQILFLELVNCSIKVNHYTFVHRSILKVVSCIQNTCNNKWPIINRIIYKKKFREWEKIIFSLNRRSNNCNFLWNIEAMHICIYLKPTT